MKRYFIIRAMILFLLQFAASVEAKTHHPQQFLHSISGSNNEGEQIYSHYCVNCHARTPLIQIGAPRMGIDADWKIRLKQGMSILLKHTDEGINAMPPRGGCFECSDKQLMLAIKYMISKGTKK